MGTFFDAPAAIPAFFSIKDDGRLALFRVRHHHIIRANFHASITPLADRRVEFDYPIGQRRIGDHIDFFVHLNNLPKS